MFAFSRFSLCFPGSSKLEFPNSQPGDVGGIYFGLGPAGGFVKNVWVAGVGLIVLATLGRVRLVAGSIGWKYAHSHFRHMKICH